MKVFALVKYCFEDYCGGGGYIEGVYASFDGAFAKVKKTLPKAEPRKNSEGDYHWQLPKQPCVDQYLAIEEYEVRG